MVFAISDCIGAIGEEADALAVIMWAPPFAEFKDCVAMVWVRESPYVFAVAVEFCPDHCAFLYMSSSVERGGAAARRVGGEGGFGRSFMV